MAVVIQYKNGVAGIKLALEETTLRIGRSDNCDICIDDSLASREHALIERVKGEGEMALTHYVVRDLESTNGTFVNHEPISTHLLVEGDMIRIGQTFFKYSENDHPELAETMVIRKTLIPGLYFTSEKKKG